MCEHIFITSQLIKTVNQNQTEQKRILIHLKPLSTNVPII